MVVRIVASLQCNIIAILWTNMATPHQQPIPLPPRTPTPPLDDQLAGFSNSPTKSVCDPSALSPLDENYPLHRNGSLPTFVTTTVHLSENDNNSIYTPASMDSHDGGRYNELPKSNSLMVEDANGVFNFHSANMARAPVSAKSVRSHYTPN